MFRAMAVLPVLALTGPFISVDEDTDTDDADDLEIETFQVSKENRSVSSLCCLQGKSSNIVLTTKVVGSIPA